MVAAQAGFALEDVFIKAAAAQMPTSQVLILLGIAGAAIFGALCAWRGEPVIFKDLRHPAVLVRNAAEFLGTFSFVSAVVLLPLAKASAIFQATPLVVTLGAAVALGMPVGWRRWAAITVGFVGVLIVIRPGFAGFEPATLFALAATVFLGVRDLATRMRPAGVSSAQLAFWGVAAAGLAGVAMLPFWGAPVAMTSEAQKLVAGAVLFGVAGYYAITVSMRLGDVAAITPFRYTRLLFAILFGFVVFGHLPDGWTLLGAALILGSGLYTLARERRARPRPLSSRPTAR